MARLRMIGIVLLFAALSSVGYGQAIKKKLIQFGWDLRNPHYVAEHIREMEKKPFDGIILSGGHDSFSDAFWHKKLDMKRVEADLKAMASIKWDKFTDNFYMMWARSNMDWFSDEDWAPDGWVLRNVRLCAKAAKVGGCVGVCFDAEYFWGRSPWGYKVQPRSNEKSFAEYEVMARKRGAQFMEALQDEFPDLVVHTFFLVSRPGQFKEGRKEPDPVKRSKLIESETYALWPAFINGMLDSAKGKTIITDGNEHAYYLSRPKQFEDSVRMMREGVKLMIDPKIWPKYQKHVQAAHAIYVDYICNVLPFRIHTSNMTDYELALHAENNVYLALKYSDQYVWMYSEYMDWWQGIRVPVGIEDAIRSAKRKLANGEPLGFDLSPAWDRSNKQWWADRASFEPKTAFIQRLRGDAPAIDGKLDEAVWKDAIALGPFVAYVEAPRYDLGAKTTARALYDRDNLYVAFECKESDLKKAREGYSGKVDDVTVMLAPEGNRKAWRAFGVGADSKRTDAHPDGDNATWKPDYESAVAFGKNMWSVEMAIPWKALNRAAPESRDKMAANVAHMRWRTRVPEYATWSKFRGKRDDWTASPTRVEPENLGTWIFE